MNTDKKNKNEGTANATPDSPPGQTEISAEIDNIGKDADAKLSRVQEKNYESTGPGNEPESGRDFKVRLNIKNLEGKISLADVIREKTPPSKKRTIL